MSDKTWKAYERRVAEYFGTVRTPLSSGKMSRHGDGDIIHDKLLVECKHRGRSIPFLKVFSSIAKTADKEKRIPILAVKSKKKRDTFLLIRMNDLKPLAEILNNDIKLLNPKSKKKSVI